MKKILFVVAALPVLAWACTGEKCPSGQSGECSAEEVTLKVSVPLPTDNPAEEEKSARAGTKVTDITGEETVSFLQVFVFRKDGTLDAWASGEGTSVSVRCTSGEKDVVGVVNAPEIKDITDKSSLEKSVSLLSDNAVGRFVMYGETPVNAITSTPVTVQVSRLVARISVGKITNAMTLEQYRDLPIRILGIYLINAAGNAAYAGDMAPTMWHNPSSLDASDLPSLLYSGQMNEEIAYGSSYETPHYFYCYPNPTESDSSDSTWSERYTRLVVEAQVGGNTYYYPVSVPSVAANCKYEITELRITRPGSSSADDPVSVEQASVTVTVKPWVGGTSGTVEI